MSSVEYLRGFVSERLTAAAEEIFDVFQKTIVEYEEEIDRQRRLLNIVWKPGIKILMTELPQQHEFEEEEDLSEQQLCIQERNSSLDQEEPEPPQIKEEQEELCISQEGEQLVLKQETDAFMWTPTHAVCAAKTESVANIPVITYVVPEAHSDQQLLSHNYHEAESQDHKRGKNEASGLTINAKRKPKKGAHAGETSNYCNICGRRFTHKSSLNAHIRGHRGEKPYSCRTCGKGFGRNSDLTVHMRTHTSEKPFTCKTCGKCFSQKTSLITHVRTHTGEKPYLCNTCGKRFVVRSKLKRHMTIHTGEKPYSCKMCGKDFKLYSYLTVHMRRAHTGEKKTHESEEPHNCSI